MLGVGQKFPHYELTGVVSSDPQTAFAQFKSSEQAGKWQVVFCWPKDFAFVCPTEIAAFGKLNREFSDRGAQLFGVSSDNAYVPLASRKQKEERRNLPFPMLCDIKREYSSGQAGTVPDAVAA
jgi:peroxiredoxin (alkyl hydroperoxide reductase subunit C)